MICCIVSLPCLTHSGQLIVKGLCHPYKLGVKVSQVFQIDDAVSYGGTWDVVRGGRNVTK